MEPTAIPKPVRFARAVSAVILCSGLLGLSVGPAAAQEFMTQAELLATIPGHTISAKSDDGTPWTQAYDTGRKKGKIKVNFGGQLFESKWYVEGDKWCENWGDGHACWDVERVKARSLRMYENGKPKKNLWVVK